jgi:hypothetical protein
MLNTSFLNKIQLKIKNKIFYFILLDQTRFNVFSFKPKAIQLEE